MEFTSTAPHDNEGTIIWASDLFMPIEDSLRQYNELPAKTRYYLDLVYDINPEVAEEFRHALTDRDEPIHPREADQAMVDFLNEHDERMVI